MNQINLSMGFTLKLIFTSSIGLMSTNTFAASLLNLSSATASSEVREANLAIDSDLNTRWESRHNIDPSYLIINLDQSYALNQMVISWEAANAKTYDILGSTDATT